MVIIANDPPGTGGLNKQIKRREGEGREGDGMEGDRKRSGPSVSQGAGRHKRRRRRPRRRRPALRGRMNRGGGEEKGDRARIIRLDISGIFTKGTRRNACSIS